MAPIAAILLAGCGGSGGKPAPRAVSTPAVTATPTAGGTAATPSGGTSIPLAQWSRRVDGLCTRNRVLARRKVDQLREQAQAEHLPENESAARVLEASRKLTAPVLAEVDALPPPEGHAKEARRFTAKIRQAFPLLEDAARALRENDRVAMQRANAQILQTALPARTLARQLGIPGCIPGAAANS